MDAQANDEGASSSAVAESIASSSSTSSSSFAAASGSSRALLHLQRLAVPHTVVRYPYVEGGGAAASTAALHLRPLHVLKTLIFADRQRGGAPFVVIQHGPLSVDVRRVAQQTGRRRGSVAMCPVDAAERWSGYRVGGTSPFGLLDPSPQILLQRTVLDLRGRPELGGEGEREAEGEGTRTGEGEAVVFINGGARGLLVRMTVHSLVAALRPTLVDVTKASAEHDSGGPYTATLPYHTASTCTRTMHVCAAVGGLCDPSPGRRCA